MNVLNQRGMGWSITLQRGAIAKQSSGYKEEIASFLAMIIVCAAVKARHTCSGKLNSCVFCD